MGLISRIDALIEERTLLQHPFYKEWSDGTLTKEALAGYSKEYYKLVQAVPGFVAGVAQSAPVTSQAELESNRQEEYDHIQYWIKFAGALGIDAIDLEGYTGLPETKRAVSDLGDLMGTLEGGACAMYALEKEIPKISQTKLDGLFEFYGIKKGPETEYFELHTEADIRHAATWRALIDETGAGFEAAEKSVSAQHLLLDGCYGAYC